MGANPNRGVGVIPVYETWGEPVQSSYNKVEEVPGYISEYVQDKNVREKKYAEECVKMEKIKKKPAQDS